MFSKAESAEISDKYTAVLLLGGDDLDDEGKAFMKRYGVGGYPTLLAMSADGAVLGREFERTLEGILGTMEKAQADNEAFLAKEGDLSGKKDPESLRELAGLYKDRAQYDKARPMYETLTTAKEPAIDDQLALLAVLEGLDDKAARKELLQVLVDTRADDARHIRWRMDLAMADLPSSVTSREEWLDVMGKRKEALGGLLESVEKPADQAIVRNALAGALANTGDMDAAMAHWEWILENARDSEVVPEALWMSAQTQFRTGRYDIEKLKAGRALLQEIVDEHTEHMLSRRARMVITSVDRAITELEKKAEEEARKAAEEEAGKDDDEDDDDGDDPDDDDE